VLFQETRHIGYSFNAVAFLTHAKPAESAGMTTNPPVDLSRINLMEPDEVQYWADKFGVSKERLSEAVAKVGHSVDAVRQELQGS